MRYRLRGNIIVKAENAAKPAAQTSRYLTNIIANLPAVRRTFDYGCGKLRYVESMRRCTETLVLVDSEVQLSRKQKVWGSDMSIRASVAHTNDVTALNVGEFERSNSVYDRGFCINMLSVVPMPSIRRRIVRLIAKKLKPGAHCLFVVQYRNSEFKRMASQPNASYYEDGILLDSLRGHSFYAIIRPEKLTSLIEDGGMSVTNLHLNEGSAYVWGRKTGSRAHTSSES